MPPGWAPMSRTVCPKNPVSTLAAPSVIVNGTSDEVRAGDGYGSATLTERMSRPAFAGAPRWLPAGEVTMAAPGSLHGFPAGGGGTAISSPALPLVPTAFVAVTW